MIVCTNCGNHNEDNDEFCGSCGKFLEWVGQRIETPAPAPEPEAAPEPEPAKAGLIDRVKAAVGIDEGSHAAATSSGGAVAPSAGVTRTEAAPGGDGTPAARQAEEARLQAEEEERAYQEAESARRAQQEAEASAVAQAEAARRAEEEARRRAEDEARARAEAEQRRRSEAEAARRAEQERRAVESAEAEAAAAAAAARQAEHDAQVQALDGAAQAAAEAEAARQGDQAAAAAAALEEAKRAEERARQEADAEARALQEAQRKEREEAEARRAAEEQARHQAAEEARAKAAAEARAREEEAARKRAAALLQRARPAPAAVPDDPVPPGVSGPATPAAMTPPPPGPVRPAAQQPVAQQPVAQQPVAQQPVAQQPVAQQPSSTRTPPRPDPKVKSAEKVLKPGDLVCGQCGEGNDPTRKFCRKCGNSLAQAAPARKIPWWKKLFSRKARVSKEAGAKGSKVRAAKEASFKVQIFLNTLRRVLMILAFVGVAGAFAVPSARTIILDKGASGLKAAQNLFNPQFEPVNAVEVSASSAIDGHGANFANDLGSNTYWAEGAEGEGIGQTISFSFESKVDLTKVIVSSGAADSPDNFLKQPRPKRLHLVFDNGGSADIVLKDEFKPQGFGLKGAKAVSKVDIAIVEVYKGQSGSDTAIAEVEFKKKG